MKQNPLSFLLCQVLPHKTHVCLHGHTYSKKSMDQPGPIANNPGRGQLKRESEYFPVSPRSFVPQNLVSRDGFGSPIPRQPAHLHTQAESGAYLLRDSSRVPRRRPFICLKPPHAIIGSVPSLLLGHHAIYCVPMAFTAKSTPAQGQQPSR